MTDEKYPEGKLNDEDEGALMVEISTEKGKVRIDFSNPTRWIAMNPDMAEAMAMRIIFAAREASGRSPVSLTVL